MDKIKPIVLAAAAMPYTVIFAATLVLMTSILTKHPGSLGVEINPDGSGRVILDNSHR